MSERWSDGRKGQDAVVRSAPLDVGPEAKEEAEANERHGQVCPRADIDEAGQDSATSREVDEESHQYCVEHSHVRRHELKEQLLLVRPGPIDDLLRGRLRRT